MVLLSGLWLLLGGVIGALALAARLRPSAFGYRGRLVLIGVGALAALLGGWLGTLLLGRLFGTPTALWLAILAVLLVWLVERLRTRAWPKFLISLPPLSKRTGLGTGLFGTSHLLSCCARDLLALTSGAYNNRW